MAARRFSILRAVRSPIRYPLGSYVSCTNTLNSAARPPLIYLNRAFHTENSSVTQSNSKNGFGIMARTGSHGSTFSPMLLNSQLQRNVSLFGASPFLGHRLYSSSTDGHRNGVPAASGGSGSDISGAGSGGSDWVEKVKDVWQVTVDGVNRSGEKAKEASAELTPYVDQLLDTHPYLRDVIVPVGCTLTATILAWVVLPSVLRRFHKFSTQGPATLLSESIIWGSVPYEKSFWGAMEDPVRYLITFMAFSQIGAMVAPITIATQYIGQAWRGAIILSFVWFLNRWKTNVFTRALSSTSVLGIDRQRLLTLDKVSSVGLFALGLMALAEACGVAVQSVLTVGGIGGVATAFAAKDILGNVLSGLSVQFSRPFTIGDTIKAGSVEGQVVNMGLTSTSLLTAEKFPVIVPNSLFSNQVIVNKSRAQWRVMVTKIPLHIGDFDKIPQISDDIKGMLLSNSNIFLEKEAPYCFLSLIEKSYAELTLGCNLKYISKGEFYSTQQDILVQSARIIKKHGGELGNTF